MQRLRADHLLLALLIAASHTSSACDDETSRPRSDGGIDAHVSSGDAGDPSDGGGADAGGTDAGGADAAATPRDAGQSPTGSVVPLRPSTIGRQAHAIVELADGKVLVTGSIRTPSPISGRPDSDLYDVVSNTVMNTGPMQDGRHSHRMNLLGDGRVLVTGGYGGTPPARWRTAELYDPTARTYSRVTSEMAVARLNHGAFRLSTGGLAGKVLLIGGAEVGASMTVEVYDPTTSSFSSVATTDAPAERENQTFVLLADESVLITAGITMTGGAPTRESYVYVPSTATFRRVGDAVEARVNPVALRLLDGRVFIAGGTTARSGGSALATTELYDPTTEMFSAGPTMSTPRRGHTAARLGSGRVVIAGGHNDTMTLGSTELFLPTTNTFSPGAALMGARSQIQSASLTDGRVFLNGGQHMTGLILDTTELFTD